MSIDVFSMDTDKGDKELLRYRPVKKKGPLAKKLEQNLCYLDMGTLPNTPRKQEVNPQNVTVTLLHP